MLNVRSKINFGMTLMVALILGAFLLSAAQASDTPAFSISNAPHKIIILDQSAPALKKRIDMIRNAKQSIDIESWNFDMSRSSRLLLRELIAKKAAEPSISIRIIVDYFVSGGLAPLNPAIAEALAKLGIEVRYYNQVSKLDPLQLDHRDHCKLFIVDNEEFIIGSRNLSDEHFGLAELRYIDVDLWIRGPMAVPVQNSFDEYWNSPIVKAPSGSFTGSKPGSLFYVSDQDRALAEKVEVLGSQALDNAPIYQASHLVFVKDGPMNEPGERQVTDYVNARLLEVRRSLVVENWSFVPDDTRLSILDGLMSRGIPIHLLTNGFDAHFSKTISTLAWIQEQKELSKGLSLYYYSAPLDEPHLDDSVASQPSIIYETHSKTAIRDERYVDIGSYNWDGRSAYINHEDLLTVDNPELAEAMIKIIRARVARSEKINADGTESDGRSILPSYLQGPKGWLKEYLIGVEGEVVGDEY
jgi:cardiolipin synthase C